MLFKKYIIRISIYFCRDRYEVQVFMIRPWPAEDDHYSEEAFADDETFQRVLRSADQVMNVPPQY